MADSELSKALRDLPNRVLNVPVEERRELFENVIAVLSNPGINSTIVRGICKVIGTTLTKYKDPISHGLVKKVILELIKTHPDLTLEHFNAVLKSIISKDLISVNLKTAQAAVIALGWSIIIGQNADRNSEMGKVEFIKLIEYQAQLYQLGISTVNQKLSAKANEMMVNYWKEFESDSNIETFYFNQLLAMEPANHIIVFLSVVINYQYEQNVPHNSPLLIEHKSLILEHFFKGLITVKVKPNTNHINSCKLIIKSIDEDDFRTKILPALQRAMLRSPEIILQGVGTIIREMEIDISEFAYNIGQILIQNLYSKDDIARAEAVESLKQIALKCNSATAIESIIKQIFAVLNGSDGKITVTEYRVNLLQGAGNLSFNAIEKSSIENLILIITPYFTKALESEIHEKVICHALDMFSLWTVNFTGEIPMLIIDAFKKGLELKSATQTVRICYLQWLLSCLENGKLPNGSDLTKTLLKSVEAAQNSNQILVLSEGVCAVCVLLKTTSATAMETNQNNKLQNFMNIVLDMQKQTFLSEKFIQTSPQNTLCYVMLMSKILLLNYLPKLKGSAQPLYRAIIFASNSTSNKVRNYCIGHIKALVDDPNNGIENVQNLLMELTEFVQNSKIYLNDGGELNGTDTDNAISSQAVIDTILMLCTIEDIKKHTDAELIALNCLLCCHQSAVYNQMPTLFESILTKLNLKSNAFITRKLMDIQQKIIDEYKPIPMYENTISTLCKLCPGDILPILIQRICKHLNNPDMSNVTDEEYFTYLLPEGELYDKSVVPNVEDIYKEISMKRENKIYSYKEQLEEIQIRREIEEKKRKDGTWKPPQFTPKQQEAIKNQMEKENGVRLRLKALNNSLLDIVSIIDGARKGNPNQLSLYFSKLLPCILCVVKSPLAATALTKLYYDLRTVCFNGDCAVGDVNGSTTPTTHSLGDMLGRVTLRLHEPHCDLSDEWTKNKLSDDIKLTLQLCNDRFFNNTIYDNNTEVEAEDDFEINKDDLVLTAPAFCYTFEFLRKALFADGISKNEELLFLSIQIIGKHARIHGNQNIAESMDYHHPKYMPRYELMKLLLQLIGIHRGRVQTQAVGALLDVAGSSSGEVNCARADRNEVECMLSALQSHLDALRDVALRALTIMCKALPTLHDDYELGLRMTRRLWIAKHDVSEENAALAEILWTNAKLEVPIVMCDELLKDVIHPEPCIQKAASASIVSILKEDRSMAQSIMLQLLEIYTEKLKMVPARLDQFNREIDPAVDQWGPRCGVAIALSHIAPYFSAKDVERIMHFMVLKGLGDREEIVHKEMLAAALVIVDLHGKDTIAKLLPLFEEFLDKAPKSSNYDNIRQAVVILMGSLARHLDKDDVRIQPIVKRLLAALSTPSQQVQEAVANCLPHLMLSIKDDASAIIKKLLNQLVKSEKYGERRGAAYGIAGVVKGLGILSLKQLDIMNKLTYHIQEKKNYKSREGALFAFEMLCTTLGRLFEPYIVHVLPHLLQCFGDSSQYVRTAADDTAKVVMAKLSAHGVKLVLPALLDALDEDSWRTKTASVELLGAMAYCAPKQLSSCLPSIVPKLIEVLGDSHTKVQEAGGDALKVIGSVIKNPEIQAIVPVLLKALEDPSTNTSKCLHSLLETKFVHFIDAPSLALIMPVVQRAFKDRSTETRKMAAQIIGNMYSLTDQKDLTPYLPSIIPGLKTSLLDPVPEVRAVSSRALGAMVKGMGESSFEDLLPWLMQTLTSESSSVDRSGAAQGLSEVVGGLGVEKLHKLMPEIIATAERTDIAPHVKDGYIMMFIYMPGAFPNEFTPYIGLIINPILKALADENEYVRDTALKAGQRIVNLYAESAVQLLLPELEKGLFDDNWRIRFSSVQLLGDLLYRISGVSGKMTTETASEDDNFGTEQSHSAIIRFLGVERRNRVLSGLYMGRSDVSLIVRQAALHVWKIVVTNTPRTLREILPTLFSLLLGCLASTSYDKRQVAARTLGDLVRKLGERVLPEIIPILERGLNSEQADQRQGVCIGLSEIMASTSRDMVLTFVNSLVPTVRKALSDPLPEVRQAAAKTFDSLHSTVGARALDDILPSMLNGLSDPDPEVAECTLDGLQQVMAIKSRVVLPYLIPQLTAVPINTKALSILASVAGEALTKYLPKILPALLQALSAAQGTPNEQQELEYCQAVILSVSDETGIRTIMDTLMESTKSELTEVRRAAATLLCAFCTHSPGDYSQYVPQLLRGLLRLLADVDRDVLQRSWDALNAVTKTLDSTQQIAHVSDVRQAVRFAASDLKDGELPGLCLPKGITPLLPVFREAILNGLPEEKENAAQGLGEVISLTSAAALQPSVVHITGPLIRILGDRFNAGVKAAVLETLAILLNKVGVMLKQFLPQLQTTFLKALHDQNRIVRMKAGIALAKLIVIHTKADPLFLEMHTSIKSNDDSGERETMLQALRGIITPAGDKMTDPLKRQVYTTLISMLGFPEDLTRNGVAGCIGALLRWLPDDLIDDALTNYILNDDSGDDWTLKHGKMGALFVAIKESPSIIYTSKYEAKIIKIILTSLTSDKIPVASNGLRSSGYLLQYCMMEKKPMPVTLITQFVRAMNHNSNEVKQLLAKTCNYLAKVVPIEHTPPEFLRPVIPMLVNGTKEKNGYVKSNSEIALIAVLRLRSGDESYQKCLGLLEAGAKDSLSEVVSKVLRKVAVQPIGKEEELDDTLISS